tara:strand:- start:183 stop:1865 length:1683 start_codon:yes stop_codon:yes gene_type:complete
MTRLFLTLLLLAGQCWAATVGWTEHRRALVINTSKDPAHDRVVSGLVKELHAKGFVITELGDQPRTDGVAYERWIRSVPTLGVSLVYYLGRLTTEKTADGKRVCYSLQLGGYRELATAQDPDLGRNRKEDKPWLSLDRLSQKLDANTARENMVLIDCLGIDDRAQAKLSPGDLHGGAARLSGGELFTAFYPGKAAFHPSLEAPIVGPVLAETLRANLAQGSPLLPERKEDVYTVRPRFNRPYALQHEAAEVCASPEVLRAGRFAGDQWVDRNGFCFVWVPAATFRMGDAAFADAQPVNVTITKGFWIGKYEVLGRESSLFNSGGQSIGTGPLARVEDKTFNQRRYQFFRPAGIGSIDAATEQLEKWQAYLAKVGLQYEGWTYDYPTEGEWELAARAGGKTTGLPAPVKGLGQYANFADVCLFNDRDPVHYIYAHREANDGYGRALSPIGNYRPNAWGIHDMHGNLAELCSNFYTKELLSGTDPNDQTLPSTRSSRLRISRGGSWCSRPEYLHVAFRNAFTGAGTPHVGMRLVLRQGERVTRSRNEIIARMEAEAKAQNKK